MQGGRTRPANDMADRKPTKKGRKTSKRAATPKGPRRAPPSRPVRRVPARSGAGAARRAPGGAGASARRRLRPGVLSHTEFASDNPRATCAFFGKVLGWTFETKAMPSGEYHLFQFGDGHGGGIRARIPGEPAGVVPYAEVRDLAAAEAAVKQAGGAVVMPATDMGDGSVMVVQVPGGPMLGLWAPPKT